MTTTSGTASPAAGEPGWFPDPWGTGKLRWWDGQAWTPHLYPPPEPAAPSPAASGSRGTALSGTAQASVAGFVAAEHVAAHWARISLLWAGPLQALYNVGVAVQAGWYADHFDQFAKGETPKLTGAAASIAPVLTY